MTLDALLRRSTHLTIGEVTRDVEVGRTRIIQIRTVFAVSGTQRGQEFTYLEQPRRRDEFPGERIGTTELLFLVAMHDRMIPPALGQVLRRYAMDAPLLCQQADPALARWRVETNTRPWRAFPPSEMRGLPPQRPGTLGLMVDPLVQTLQRTMTAVRGARGHR